MKRKTVNHHPFPDGIHVEVVINEGNGDISTRSVEFDVTDEEGRSLRPREGIPESDADEIMDYLRKSGYEVENSHITS